MKNSFFWLTYILFVSLFTACKNDSPAKKTIDSAANSTVTSLQRTEECYIVTKNRDTAVLMLKFSGRKVTGALTYNLFEKDRNSGTISGKINGNTILADYAFEAEGIQSIRQVAFLIKGNQLVEGFSDVKQQGGKTVFQKFSDVKFGQGMVFNKTNCK